jgi:hypothetical protein
MEHDTPKMNVWCALASDFLIRPFIFEEATVTEASDLNMLKNYAITQIPQRCIFQQDGAPPHLCQPSESLSQSAVSRHMEWQRWSYHKSSQVTRFDPCRFLSMGVHKGFGVPNEGARCG